MTTAFILLFFGSFCWALGYATCAILRGNGDDDVSLSGLRGLGAEIWEGEDAQEYVDRERDAIRSALIPDRHPLDITEAQRRK